MKARIISDNTSFLVQKFNGWWYFGKWETVANNFLSVKEAENWINENLFPIYVTVVAEYKKGIKTVNI